MRTIALRSTLSGVALALCLSSAATLAQAPSAGLGATRLDGLTPFTDCLEKVKGHREHLIAGRLAARLAMSTALSARERAVWQGDIDALRAVTPKKPNFAPPDPKDPQHYLMGLTDAEQQSINSMSNRFSQETNLECERKYGGMTRYSPGSDQSAQRRYEEQLRANMGTPIDIATIAVTPLPSPFPKTREQIAAEQQAARAAQRAQTDKVMKLAMEGAMARTAKCQEETKGLQLTIVADYMQRNLAAAKGLSAKDRSEFEADIKATRSAAAAGLQMAPPLDPANPMRGINRLTPQQQMEAASEYGQKMVQHLTACQTR